MIFIDSNIFMYAAGTPHDHKIPSVAFLHKIASRDIEGCISTEVLQEILHRYRFINRWEDGKEVFHLAKKISPIILPVDPEVLDKAFILLEKYPSIYARDAVHTATCLVNSVDVIVSYDKDFDAVDEISRKEPKEV